MNIKVDEAIRNGIYIDKETITLVDNTESINLYLNENTKSNIEKITNIIASISGFTETETELYTELIRAERYTNNLQVVSEFVPRLATGYDKSERSFYKAIKGLVDKRVITYKGTNAIQLNKSYNFIKPAMKEQKFLIIRLTD